MYIRGLTAAAAALAVLAAVGATVTGARGQTAYMPLPPERPLPASPDPTLTPGTLRGATQAEVCSRQNPETRNTSRAEKQDVARAYGLGSRIGVNMDHLVPLSLGGADVPGNLWPQERSAAVIKDRCERRARALVCRRGGSLADVQRGMQSDFRALCAQLGVIVP